MCLFFYIFFLLLVRPFAHPTPALCISPSVPHHQEHCVLIFKSQGNRNEINGSSHSAPIAPILGTTKQYWSLPSALLFRLQVPAISKTHYALLLFHFYNGTQTHSFSIHLYISYRAQDERSAILQGVQVWGGTQEHLSWLNCTDGSAGLTVAASSTTAATAAHKKVMRRTVQHSTYEYLYSISPGFAWARSWSPSCPVKVGSKSPSFVHSTYISRISHFFLISLETGNVHSDGKRWQNGEIVVASTKQ